VRSALPTLRSTRLKIREATVKEFRTLADVSPEDVLTPKIAAALIHRKEAFIRKRIRTKELPASNRGGYLINGGDFLLWLKGDDTKKNTGSENSDNPPPPIPAASGASMSTPALAAKMASLSLQRGIASR
jgi:hypothetical protein